MPNRSKDLLESTAIHFVNILDYINCQKNEFRQSYSSLVPDITGAFGNPEGIWGDIVVPHFDISSIDALK
jgi:hypothetical protein